MSERHLSRNDQLRGRARAVIPGGMYGHNVQKFLWPGAPQFWDRAKGSRVWDVDGHEYVDLMCSWGPIVHGHRHPVVEKAAATQRERVDTGNGPGEVFVELAELLVRVVGGADWAIFAKNGGDVTTLALTVARAATGRSTVLAAEGAYHGSLPWCNPGDAGIAPGDRAHLDYFQYNDLASMRAAVADHVGDLAAVILTPLKQDAGQDQELALPGFARGVRELCDETGAVLILDEVRAGFRMSFGSSWAAYDVSADLSCWSKAIANGYPISALLGADAFRSAASSVFSGGTFWTSGVPMAAALASIRLLEAEDGLGRMEAMGTQLVTGIAEQAAAHGIGVRISGPTTMPYLAFDGDRDWGMARRWAAGAAMRGLYVNPSHNWFTSTALSAEDVTLALEAADGAFADLVTKGPLPRH